MSGSETTTVLTTTAANVGGGGGGFYPADMPELDMESIVPNELFFYVSAGLTALILVKSYIDMAVTAAASYPQLVALGYTFGAWALSYVTLSCSVQLGAVAHTSALLQMVRSSLMLGGLITAFGPLLVIVPVNKRRPRLRIEVALRDFAQHQSTRR
eukprot:UC1_evm1s1098